MYLQCSSNKSRTAIIHIYTVCLLYVLSTASVVSDLVAPILQVSNNPICKNIIFLSVVKVAYQYTIASTSNWLTADDISPVYCPNHSNQWLWLHRPMHPSTHCTYHPFHSPKSLKIYRCWIVWGQNIRIVIIPSFLAIAYLGQSIDLHLICRFQFIASSYLASAKWRNGNCTRPNSYFWLGGHGVSNKSRFVHDREYLGDGLDRVQDPQGILGS